MTSQVTVESQADFEAWLKAQQAAANDPGQLFTAMGCPACHTLSKAGAAGKVGPHLDNLPQVAGTRVAGMDAAAYVEQSIVSPDSFVVSGFPAGVMPKNFGERLSPDQLKALVDFLLGQPK
jgi:cytochrome c5